MRTGTWKIAVTLGVVLGGTLAPVSGVAHGPVHAHIREVSQAIVASPDDAQLRVRRGRLWLEASHPRDAASDFRRAVELDPELRGAYYFLGQAELASGHTRAADRAAQQFLQRLGPDDRGARIRGHVLCAEVATRRRRWKEADEHYGLAFELSERPDPDQVLAHAAMLVRARQLDDAVAVLDRANHRLGDLISLHVRALSLEQKLGDSERVLSRLEHLIALSPQPAQWWLEKGLLLDRTGARRDARDAARRGLAALDKLPAGRRSAPPLRKLEHRLRSLSKQR